MRKTEIVAASDQIHATAHLDEWLRIGYTVANEGYTGIRRKEPGWSRL
jgi:hypothetical protein